MKSSDGASTPPPTRPYDSTRRRARAEDRRRHVIEVATQLFLEQGYGATSIDQIGRAADVSPQSIYATFENKASILAGAVHLARTGDPDGRGRDLPEAASVLGAPDLRERCRRTAAMARRMYRSSATLIAMVERAAATDAQLADLHDRFRAQRRDSVAQLTADVPSSAFRKGLTRQRATDSMAFLVDARTYTELVDGMGWTPARYEAWLGDALYRLHFAD